jgi:hypothetical protein
MIQANKSEPLLLFGAEVAKKRSAEPSFFQINVNPSLILVRRDDGLLGMRAAHNSAR